MGKRSKRHIISKKELKKKVQYFAEQNRKKKKWKLYKWDKIEIGEGIWKAILRGKGKLLLTQ